jgi:hypothetical protein
MKSMRRLLGLAIAAASFGLLGGCPQSVIPDFTPGNDDNVFGTLDDRLGNLFDISVTEDGEVLIEASGENGVASFTLDPQGRLSAAEGENGTDVDLSYNDDGSVDVSGTFVNGGEATPFEGTIPADLVPNAKPLTAQLSQAQVCDILSEFCAAWPDLFDAILSAGFDQLGELDLPGGQVFEFPTGNAAIDNVIRNVLRQRLALLFQIDAFCEAWSNADRSQICGE